MPESFRLRDEDRIPAATQEIEDDLVKLLQGWQDSEALLLLHGHVQANLVMCVIAVTQTPDTRMLRRELQDFAAAAWAFAHAVQQHCDRIDARSN